MTKQAYMKGLTKKAVNTDFFTSYDDRWSRAGIAGLATLLGSKALGADWGTAGTLATILGTGAYNTHNYDAIKNRVTEWLGLGKKKQTPAPAPKPEPKPDPAAQQQQAQLADAYAAQYQQQAIQQARQRQAQAAAREARPALLDQAGIKTNDQLLAAMKADLAAYQKRQQAIQQARQRAIAATQKLPQTQRLDKQYAAKYNPLQKNPIMKLNDQVQGKRNYLMEQLQKQYVQRRARALQDSDMFGILNDSSDSIMSPQNIAKQKAARARADAALRRRKYDQQYTNSLRSNAQIAAMTKSLATMQAAAAATAAQRDMVRKLTQQLAAARGDKVRQAQIWNKYAKQNQMSTEQFRDVVKQNARRGFRYNLPAELDPKMVKWLQDYRADYPNLYQAWSRAQR